MQYIDLAGQKYPLRMSLRAMKQITERFGGMDKVGEAISDSANMSAAIDVLNDLLKILMQAGRNYAVLTGEEVPPDLPCDPADILGPTDMAVILAKITATMTNDTAREVETVPKNGTAM